MEAVRGLQDGIEGGHERLHQVVQQVAETQRQDDGEARGLRDGALDDGGARPGHAAGDESAIVHRGRIPALSAVSAARRQRRRLAPRILVTNSFAESARAPARSAPSATSRSSDTTVTPGAACSMRSVSAGFWTEEKITTIPAPPTLRLPPLAPSKMTVKRSRERWAAFVSRWPSASRPAASPSRVSRSASSGIRRMTL